MDFDFDFATTNLSAGGQTSSGDTNTTDPYELDNDSVMELFGLELIGPVSAIGARQKIESIKILVDGSEVDDIVFNELMAPAYNAASPNRPFFGGSGQLSMRPPNMCFNLGVPLLMGGSPMDATIKVGPQETLGFRIKAPRGAENGATINENVKIRANIIEAKTKEVVERTLSSYGLVSGGNVDQSFTVMDLSTNDKIEVTKTLPLDLDNWTGLYGGQAAAKPYVTNYITYAQNATATTENSAYRFTMDGNRVLHDDMKFYWNLDQKKAVRLTHVAALQQANLKYMRMYISGRENPGNEWHIVDLEQNMFPMPLNPLTANMSYVGPAEFPRAELIHNQKAYLEVKDDGTSIPAWASGVSGAMIAFWGKKFEGLPT
ncbi:MAG: hypothetical protein BA864_14175 [Desulfuromonadales bacterium C00003093]|nr:MAG: hypothetical protein BA864_14175 [Desulfuromonadales bacterium C00003093]